MRIFLVRWFSEYDCSYNAHAGIYIYKDAEKRIRKPKTQFGDESNGLVLHQHDKFRIEVFLPILDNCQRP